MGKRYLHEALRNASINPVLYYSVEDVARLIESLTTPIPTTGIAMRKNLRMFARRNIHDEFSKQSEDGKQYLGGAWLYPISHVCPKSLSELRGIHRKASFLASEKEEIMPKDQEIFSSTASSQQPKHRSNKVALFLSLFSAAAFLIAAYKLDGFQRFSRTPPSEYASLYTDHGTLSIRDRYYRAESLFFKGDVQGAQQEAISILNQRNLSTEEAGDAYSLLAKVMGRNGNLNAAIDMLDLADREYASSEDEFIANYNMGRRRNLRSFRASLNYQNEDYEKGLSELIPLYEIGSKSGEIVHQGYIALMVADGLFWLGRSQEALTWNKRAAKHYRTAGDVTGIANASLNEAWTYL